jgi:hypothetical protein
MSALHNRRSASTTRWLLFGAAVAAGLALGRRRAGRQTATLSLSGRQLTTATDSSWSTGAGIQALGFDSPPIASSYLSNPEVAGVEHAQPYYPPGSLPDGKPRGPDRAANRRSEQRGNA